MIRRAAQGLVFVLSLLILYAEAQRYDYLTEAALIVK